MKRVFIDTNVFIDYLGQRGQFYGPAAKIVSLADMGFFLAILNTNSSESPYKKALGRLLFYSHDFCHSSNHFQAGITII